MWVLHPLGGSNRYDLCNPLISIIRTKNSTALGLPPLRATTPGTARQNPSARPARRFSMPRESLNNDTHTHTCIRTHQHRAVQLSATWDVIPRVARRIEGILFNKERRQAPPPLSLSVSDEQLAQQGSQRPKITAMTFTFFRVRAPRATRARSHCTRDEFASLLLLLLLLLMLFGGW